MNAAPPGLLAFCFAFLARLLYSLRMKISFRRFDLKLTRPWRIARGVDGGDVGTFPVVFLELDDGKGQRGIGEGAPSSHYQESVGTVEAFLRKVEAGRLSFEDIAGSMKYLDSVGPGDQTAKCALNIALLDGAAQAAGQPIYDYLKLGFTEQKHVTSFSIGIDTPEVIGEKVREAGRYPVLKLKVGSRDDQKNFAALREAAPAKPVRVDANEAWKTKEEALRNIEWLHGAGGVQFVEQPMPATSSREDMRWLKERSPLPLYGDESYHRASDVTLAADMFHGVNVKLVKSGGISGAYDALQAARQAGLKTMLGCMIESSLLITAAAHLAELTDHLDLDGNLLIKNDPHAGVSGEKGVISFTGAPGLVGLRAHLRP